MFRGLTNEDSVRGIDEAVEVFSEMVLIELLDAFILVLTVVGEAVDSGLSSLIVRQALVDEGDGVLHSEVIDGSDVVFGHKRKTFL